MTAPRPNPTTPAEWIAVAAALLAASPDCACPPAYDGPEPHEERMTDREADMAADRYYERRGA